MISLEIIPRVSYLEKKTPPKGRMPRDLWLLAYIMKKLLKCFSQWFSLDDYSIGERNG